MATMISEVYAAFIDAGASPEKAQKAAEAIAGYENRFNKLEQEFTVVKWMLGANLALTTALVVRMFTT